MKLRALLLLLGPCAGAGLASAQTTECASVGPGGLLANDDSNASVSMSADGRFVAFSSSASNLVPGDTNNLMDVFVFDRQAGTTRRTSVDSAGTQGNAPSFKPLISADGRFVAFSSLATNLVAGDTNGTTDVFVHDRLTGLTERVSVGAAGVEGNDPSTAYSISADGRFVGIYSWASNLVAGDTNSAPDCFVRDCQGGTTERASVSSNGSQAAGSSGAVVVSAEGRFVAFGSHATNLVAGDTNGTWDIFVRDRQNGTTERVSVASGGAQGNGSSYGTGDLRLNPSISSDGRFVAFCSAASNLCPGDTNGSLDVFVHDRLSGITERVSVDSAGVEADGASSAPALSPDGRYVAFDSQATNLVAGDTNGHRDVFVHDRLAGTTERLSVDAAGVQGDGDSEIPCISADSRSFAFGSRASNLVPLDFNGCYDIFVRDLGLPPAVPFCTPGRSGTLACPCSNPPAGRDRGCDNSQSTGGASIRASGSALLSADTLVLTTAGERSSAESIVLQGSVASTPGSVFGQGVRCVGGTLRRLYVETASGGSIGAPTGAEPSVSARSAALGDTLLAGEHRFYMVYYRDPFLLGGCAATSTFNATNAVDVPWQP
jgi:Tol biopolymer transport system component